MEDAVGVLNNGVNKTIAGRDCGQFLKGRRGERSSVYIDFEVTSMSILHGGYVLRTTELRHNFLTCDGHLTFLSFAAYIKDFEMDFLITAGISVILITTLLKIAFDKLRLSDSALFFIYKIIMEQGIGASSKLEKTPGYKIFATVLILIGFEVTNLYKGTVTTDFTAPLPRAQIKTIAEAVEREYKIYLSLNNQRHEYLVTGMTPESLKLPGHKKCDIKSMRYLNTTT